MKKILIASALLAILFVSFSCAKTDEKPVEYNTYEFFCMDTFITLSGENISKDDFREIEDLLISLEKSLSRTDEESEIYALNHAKSLDVSDKTAYILLKVSEIAQNTGGAYNACMGKISELWDITGKKYIPFEKEIQDSLIYCDHDGFSVSGNRVNKKYEETVIDLGGSAKGYAAGKAIEKLKELGIDNAMISLGGNIALTGHSRSREDVWRVGVKNPFYPDEIAGYVDFTDKIIAVSGDYERYFVRDGKIYHHIFDPKTGYPCENGVKSVAVISENGLEADALSTALFVMGKDKALEFYNSKIYDFEAVIFTSDGVVYLTDGLKNDFELIKEAKYKDNISIRIAE